MASKTAPDGFDIIIDDASHIGELTKTSFWHLFDHHLKPGGLYAIEDWGTGYLDDFTDGRKFQPRISIRARVRSLGKNFAFAVDTAWECGNLFVPLEAGLHYFGVRSTYILGLQIGSILSRQQKRKPAMAAGRDFVGTRSSFFCGQNVVNGWFFDIYIQGSKKYSFKS